MFALNNNKSGDNVIFLKSRAQSNFKGGIYIQVSNIKVFILGLFKMILYAVCKNCFLSDISNPIDGVE